MVISVAVDVNEIAHLGKDFPWIKPSGCPRCEQPLWWHGFVLAYFSCLLGAVYLRRLRCPCCRTIHRLKPVGYWRRFRSPVTDIDQVVTHRQNSGRWLHDQPRTRQRQWWRRLQRMTQAVLGLSIPAISAFATLSARGFIPVSRSFYCDTSGIDPPPYRTVSLPSVS